MNGQRKAFGISMVMVGVATITIPMALSKSTDSNDRVSAKRDINSLESALPAFRLDCDRYPTTKEGLASLRRCPADLNVKWKGPYLTKALPKDHWGHAYVYKNPGVGDKDSFFLASYGSDGKPGGTGEAADIVGGSGN